MKTNDTQPVFVLERIYEIMKEYNITDNRRVGLYGITYKENVDDIRECPPLQMLDIQERHLARSLKVLTPSLQKKSFDAESNTRFRPVPLRSRHGGHHGET